MKTDKNLQMLLIVLALAVCAAGAFAQDADEGDGEDWTQDGESGAALPEMLVEAENEVRQEIEKGTFTFELDAATVDSFFTAMDAEVLGVSPVSGLQPHYPAEPEGHKVRDWTLAVTDFRGSPFRTFTGGGNPPDRLDWDGIGDNGEMLQVGYPYSYVFTMTDKGTNTYNHAGISFRVPALDFRRDGDRVLEIAGGQLFIRNETELTPGGEDWLTRASDEIRQHPWSPLRVIVTAETQALADQRADHVATYLATAMILPREQVETEAVQRPDLKAEMDGSVAVVIEHVEN